MIKTILQYRPLDHAFLLCIDGKTSVSDCYKILKHLPGNLHNKNKLTPTRIRIFLPNNQLIATYGIPLHWQFALPWLSSLQEYRQCSSNSLIFWITALRFLQSLIIRGSILPKLSTNGKKWRASWNVNLSNTLDRNTFTELVKSMPYSIIAFPQNDSCSFTKKLSLKILGSEDINNNIFLVPPDNQSTLKSFLDDGADFMVRRTANTLLYEDNTRLDLIKKLQNFKRNKLIWSDRLILSLSNTVNEFPHNKITERTINEQLEQWSKKNTQLIKIHFNLKAPVIPENNNITYSINNHSQNTWKLQINLQNQDNVILSVSKLWHCEQKTKILEIQHIILQDIAKACQLFPPLQKTLLTTKIEDIDLRIDEVLQFILHGAIKLKHAGFIVNIPKNMINCSNIKTIKAKIVLGARQLPTTTNNNHISVDWLITIGSDAIHAKDFLGLIDPKYPILFWKGQWMIFNQLTFHRTIKMIQINHNKLVNSISKIEALASSLIGATYISDDNELMQVETVCNFKNELEELYDLSNQTLDQPKTFIGSLRPYQLKGLAWLEGLHRSGLGGILADDMGLGKTIEVIAFLLYLQEKNLSNQNPILLVCPTSLLGNWRREITKFAPSIPCFIHHGHNRKQLPQCFDPYTVILTTYGILRREEAIFIERKWDILIIDEAQAIKNHKSHQSRIIQQLTSPFKLAITGTPIENKLLELWSIISFVLPGYLRNEAAFKEYFVTPIEKHRNQYVTLQLKKLIVPFVLRRLKSDNTIINELPLKQETKIYTQLTQEQAILYQTRINQIKQDITDINNLERQGHILTLLTQLKQICNHPSHFLKQLGPYQERSAKLERLKDMVLEVLASGEKAIIFTQFKEMGHKIQTYLTSALGFQPAFLYGSTTREQRDEIVRNFQENPNDYKVIILTLKAGGVGLNLTAANNVFHFDRWWNPAVEDQATDRAYRIGQTKNVQVYKFIILGTLEEKIDSILELKRNLADLIVGTKEDWLTELNYNTLCDLVSLDPEIDILGETESLTSKINTISINSTSINNQTIPQILNKNIQG